MNKYYNVYDDVYDNGKEDRNYNNNADYGSVSNGLIFDPITTPWYCRGQSVYKGIGAAAHYISTLLKMYHKLL